MSVIDKKARDVVVSNCLAAWVNSALFYGQGKITIHEAIRNFRDAYNIEEDDMCVRRLYLIYNRYQHQRRNKFDMSKIATGQSGLLNVEMVEGSELLDVIKTLINKLDDLKTSDI